MFRMPARFRLLTSFGLIAVAVFGIEQFRSVSGARPKGRIEPLALILLLGALVAATLVGSSLLATALALVTAGLLAAGWLVRPGGRLRTVIHGALLAVVMLDVRHATGAHGPWRDLPVRFGQAFRFRGAEDSPLGASEFSKLLELSGYDRVNLHQAFPTKTIRPLGRAYMISDYEPMSPNRRRRLNAALGGSPACVLWGLDPDRHPGLYDLTSVRYELSLQQRHAEAEGSEQRPSANDAADASRLRARTNTDALPRAYLVGAYEICSPDEALRRVATASFDFRTTVLLEKDPGMPASATGHALEPAKIIAYAPQRVAIATQSDRPQLLVLTDTYYPGWRAFVDDVETEVFQANYVFRAVRVPSGLHVVVFEYRPASYRIGVMLSVVSIGALAIVCAVVTYRPRKHSHLKARPS